ncbi:hypothetical protein AAD018_005925 [Aestuariibius insulae]|uniref:hypothetical protein n=1 Tax=Aestuariibius insulae TaxID=2058287 RepID=UPI00345E563B
MDKQKEGEAFRSAWKGMNGQVTPLAMRRFEARREAYTPFQIAKLDPIFRDAVRYHVLASDSWISRLSSRRSHVDPTRLFRDHPQYALMALHAPSGQMRELAVRWAPMKDPAALTMLLLRCNDWSAVVRTAAFKRLDDSLSQLNDRQIAQLALFLLARVPHWGRGGADVLPRFKALPKWPAAVKMMLKTSQYGPLAKTMRQLLRHPDHDWMLPELAMRAKSAFVRAVACDTVLTGRAKWHVGYDWVWEDRVYNLGRRRALYDSRPVPVSSQCRAMILRSACNDKSAKVRCLAAEYFISNGIAKHGDLAQTLLQDRARTVRERMTYSTKKWSAHPEEIDSVQSSPTRS